MDVLKNNINDLRPEDADLDMAAFYLEQAVNEVKRWEWEEREARAKKAAEEAEKERVDAY